MSLVTAAKYESTGFSYCLSPDYIMIVFIVILGAKAQAKEKEKNLILAISGAFVDACILAVFTVNQGLYPCACAFVCSFVINIH